MKIHWIILLVSLVFWIEPVFSKDTKDVSNFFNTSFGDYQDELETAKEENKKGVMLFFEMDECPFCHWMKINILNQSPVQDYFKKHFNIFAIDIEGDIEITDFKGDPTTEKRFSFEQFRVRATPVIAFFDLNGELMTKFTGRAANIKEFNLLGKYVVSGAYKEMKFSKYKRNNK